MKDRSLVVIKYSDLTNKQRKQGNVFVYLDIMKTEYAKQFIKDVFDIELQSETYDDCVQELKEIMRMED